MNDVQSMTSAPRGLDLLWGAPPRGARGPAARYTIGDIASAAVRLADADGLDAVTLAAVARELALTTTALYRYVDTKPVLIEVMTDAAIGLAPRVPGRTWQARARAWALALAARYRAHPWLAAVQPAGMPRCPQLYAWLDVLVSAVDGTPAEPGTPDAPGVDALRLGLLLDAVIRGYVDLGVDPAPPPGWLVEGISTRHPRLAARLARDWSDTERELTHAIDVVLAGAAATPQPEEGRRGARRRTRAE